jgi:hypothetical protein
MKSRYKNDVVSTTKVEYLKTIRKKLENEVGSYFLLLNESRKVRLDNIGFLSSIRLLMPFVETIGKTLKISPQEVLLKADVKTPHLFWEMFRHPLTHGNQLSHIKYKDREISWGLAIGSGNGSNHIIQSDHISIDINYLYNQLLLLLNNEIEKNDVSEIQVEVGIIIDDTAPPYILEDLEKIK